MQELTHNTGHRTKKAGKTTKQTKQQNIQVLK